MNQVKFFRCEHCGNFVSMINHSGAPMTCCSDQMKEVTANTTEAATEKHIPSIVVEGDTVTVQVGSVLHPMAAEHYIEFIFLHTQKGNQIKYLNPGDQPIASFTLKDDMLLGVYEYCNIHGLWKLDVPALVEDETVCSAEFSDGCIG